MEDPNPALYLSVARATNKMVPAVHDDDCGRQLAILNVLSMFLFVIK